MKLSVIIPTLNEAGYIGQSIDSAASGGDVEIIVIDGGSDDGTVEQAEAGGVKILTSRPGRAQQMNTGAYNASGDTLLFLHADTRLPEGYVENVNEVLSRGEVAAGAFELSIDSPKWGLRVIERLANWRSHRFDLPYGDQAIFLKTDTFKFLGGFPYIPIMEDFELVKRLRDVGRIVTVPLSAETSPRRWDRAGILKATLINQWVIMAYRMGVSPENIAARRTRMTGP